MEQFHKTQFISKIGVIELTCQEDCITELTVVLNPESNTLTGMKCPVCSKAVLQLQEYFSGQRQEFDVPIQFHGSKLQTDVWNYLKSISYGSTVSYSDVAMAVGCKSVRAVATAVGQNPIPIIVPCHRVIRKNGLIGQFSLVGPEVKKFLLNLESTVPQEHYTS